MKYLRWVLLVVGLPLFFYGIAAEPDTRLTFTLSFIGAVFSIVGIVYPWLLSLRRKDDK